MDADVVPRFFRFRQCGHFHGIFLGLDDEPALVVDRGEDAEDRGKIDATIVWNSGEYYGCQFELPIPPSVLSAALLKNPPATPAATSDAVAELRELSSEVERLSLMMERALKRLARD